MSANNGARVPGADALADMQQEHYNKMAAAQGLMNLRPPGGEGGRKMLSHRRKSSRKMRQYRRKSSRKMRQHRRKSLRTRRGRSH